MNILILTMLLFSCHSGQHTLGSKKNPVKLYFSPSIEADSIMTTSKKFIEYMEKETGYYFETGIPASFIAVVEALGSHRADIAMINTLGYLKAHQLYGAKAKLIVLRDGQDHYLGEIVARADGKVKTLQDINGKNFAYVDSTSTGGYLYPAKLLKDNGVVPKNVVFAGKHDSAMTMVYQGQVDAAATFYTPPDADGKIRDGRKFILEAFPDAAEKLSIIAFTDKILNGPFVFRKELSDEMVNKITDAIVKLLATEEGSKLFQDVYAVNAVRPITDDAYQPLMEMVKEFDLPF